MTWELVSSVGAAGEAWGGFQIAIADDGSMTLFTRRNVSGEQGDNEEFILFRSVDDGLTWTELDRYTWDPIATFGRPITLQNGDLLASYHGRGWGMVRSTDDGLTWTREATTNGGPWMGESHMIQADDGTIIAFGRNGNLDVFYSDDDGHSWTQGVDTGITAGTEETGNKNTAAVIRDASGHVQLIWISRDTYKMYYTETTVEALLDSPTAWEPSRALVSIGGERGGDIGYPTMIFDAAGRLFLAWYEDPDLDHGPSIFTSTLYDFR